MRFVWLLSVAALTGAAQAPQGPAVPQVDWEAMRPEILRHFRALVQIDSSNPPGNETKVVEYLKGVFDAEGIDSQALSSDPARANLVARIRGNGAKRPILLMAHTDVVGVQKEKWPVEPFGAVLKDGYVWGRGVVDDKDNLAANLAVMLALKRSGARLDRDVIFLAESAEEGTTGPGIDFVVREHFDLIDAEFALAEGGYANVVDGKVRMIAVATGEKLPRRARLVVNGTSGHGSVPRVDNPLVRLSAAVAKLGTWRTPMRLNDTTRTYFERLANLSAPEERSRYNGLLDPARSEAIQDYLAENEPSHYSMLRTSVVPTILQAGFRMNVIPSEAEATIDVRMLPDEDIDGFYKEMERVVGDPAVKIERLAAGARTPTPPSRLETDMFRALESVSARMYGGAPTLPMMMTGATDMAQLRATGIQAYGIGPALSEQDRVNFGAHSDVERIPETSLYDFVKFTWDVVMEVAAPK